MPQHFPSRDIPIKSVSLTWLDVKKLFERLKEIVRKEGEEVVPKLAKPSNMKDEEWPAEKKRLLESAFRVTVTIGGTGGETLFGDALDLFDSPDLPDDISLVYMTNRTAFRREAGTDPVRVFELTLDFSRPPLIDGKQIVSAPTANNSKLNIQGDSNSWVATVNDAVMGLLKLRQTRTGFVHKSFVYDIGLMIVALPIAFYLAWETSLQFTKFTNAPDLFIRSALYVYEIIAVTWLYRILFGYTKWIYPTVELKENLSSSKLHRAFWITIILAILGNLAYDLLKRL
jgi:hypothetical protein